MSKEKFSFHLEKTDGAARAGEIITPHGKIQTPIFMPVGTRSALKGLTTDQVREIGAEIMLVNNYHSYLRPGTEVIESFGGLHEFMNVDFPILTDSGGFQVFSLGKASFGKEVPTKEAEDSPFRDDSSIRIPFREDLVEKAKELRNIMTGPEKKIWYDIFTRNGFKDYRFLRQKPLLDYIVDFYCHELQIAIEIDGESHVGNEEYDKKRTEELVKEGIFVLRFSNDEVLKNIEGVYNKLEEVVQGREAQKQQRIPPTPLSKGGNQEPLAKITEEGVHFRSYLDGSKHFFNPENVMDMQSAFGADIIMAFDECAPGGSTREYARAAMERTHRWAMRSKEQWLLNEKIRDNKGLHPQALFGIIQGVVYDDLRAESAEFIKNLDLPGIAIGGLSVGESKEDMYRIMDVLEPILPKEKPHYLMGVGTPEDIVEGIARGIDMFDCVLATRIGRHGEAFSSYGNIKIGGEKYKMSQEKIPMLGEHETMVSRRYPLGYLRHLVNVGEATGGVLLSLHNIEYLLKLTKTARQAIFDGRFAEFRERFWSVYPGRSGIRL